MTDWKPMVLATTQLAAFIYIAVTAPWRAMPAWLLSIAAVGLLIGLWAVVAMGLRRLRVRPEPHPDAVLLTTGPYRYVRHPMYTAVVLTAFAAVASEWRADQVGIGILLAVILALKIRMEERMLAEKFADYDAYRRSTGAICPKVGSVRDER